MVGLAPIPIWKPQTSVSYEAGLLWQPLQNRLNIEITYFNRAIKNVIAYDYNIGYINQDQRDDYGLEAQLTYKTNDIWSVVAHYNFLDGTFTTTNSLEQDTTFYNLIRRPRHSFGLTAYINPIKNLQLSVNTQFYGKRIDYFYDPVTFARETVNLDSYLLLNAYAAYHLLNQKLTFFADFKNITDADFVEAYGYSTIGFNAQAGVRFQF